MTEFRCPFCLYAADPSIAAASRLLAVHLVSAHPPYADEVIRRARREAAPADDQLANDLDEVEDGFAYAWLQLSERFGIRDV